MIPSLRILLSVLLVVQSLAVPVSASLRSAPAGSLETRAFLEAVAAQAARDEEEARRLWQERRERVLGLARTQAQLLGVPREEAPELPESGPGDRSAVLPAAPADAPRTEPPAPAIPPVSPDLDETLEGAAAYWQKAYKLVDPQGDVSLAVLTRIIPMILLKILLGVAPMPPDADEHRTLDINPVIAAPAEAGPAQASAFNLDAMTRELAQVLAQEETMGLPPAYGQVHEWSPEFIRSYWYRPSFLPFMFFSKLLTALASGRTWRFMVTEKELELLTWVLRQPDASITVPEMLRASYRLNNGDVYLALLTVENVLCEYWRDPERENRAVTRKLAALAAPDGPPDKFGEWYHLFGIMLYGYAYGPLSAGLVARVENLGARLLKSRRNEAKSRINIDGAALGARLAEMVLSRGESAPSEAPVPRPEAP